MRELYETFHETLGSNSYVLPTGHELKDDRTRLFAMYQKKTHHLVKETVEKEFCKLDGSVRVVFCTIAFGMGSMWKVPTLPFILALLAALTTIFKKLVELVGVVTSRAMLYFLHTLDAQGAKISQME